jgi:hypothetical protein
MPVRSRSPRIRLSVPPLDFLRSARWRQLCRSVALVVGAAVLAVGFLAGAASAARGGETFPLTRAALRFWKRYWWV